MLETYEPTETAALAAGPGRGVDADDEAAARRALQAGVAAVWLFPLIQLRVAEGAGFFGLSTLLSALAAGGLVGQFFLLAQQHRIARGARFGYAALAARSTSAALGAGALATLFYRVGQSVPWAMLGAVIVFWVAAQVLDRSDRAGFPLAVAGCVVLFAVLPFAGRTHVPLTGADPSALGSLGLLAAFALVAGRRRDQSLAHLERLRAAEVRELAPGQEPDGPQDAVPPEYLAAARERTEAAEQAANGPSVLQRVCSGETASTIVLVGDLILALAGYRGMAAIGVPGIGNSVLTTGIAGHGFNALLLGGALFLGLVLLAVLAARAGKYGLVAAQCCLMLCTLLLTVGLAVAAYHGDHGLTPQNAVTPATATTGAGNGNGGGNAGYCFSGGNCYGKAAQEG